MPTKKMKYLIDGTGSAADDFDPSIYRVAVQGLGAQGTTAVFRDTPEMLKWVRKGDPKTAKSMATLSSALTHLHAVLSTRPAPSKAMAGISSPGAVTGIKMYEHADYKGQMQFLAELIPFADFRWFNPNFNDRLTSYQLTSATAIFTSDINFGGAASWVLGPQDVPNIGAAWNDRVSSACTGASWDQIVWAVFALLGIIL